MTIRATTSPGLEDIASAEGGRLLRESGFFAEPIGDRRTRAFGLDGVVGWTLEPAPPYRQLTAAAPFSSARSLYHVAAHIAEIDWDGVSLGSLVDGVSAVDLDEMVWAASFRVSCTRVGDHGFHSPDVEREVGTVLQQRYRTAVDLEAYELHVKVDIVGSRALCGYQLTRRKGLDRRHRWIYHPRVTLRAPIAYAMLVLAGYEQRPGSLHDPFCGSGTILLEAAGIARDRGELLPPLSGSDRDPRAVDGASRNLEAAAIAAPVTMLDARQLADALPEGSLDYIVTNPPFGIRMAHRENLSNLYRGFLAAAVPVLRAGGTLVVLAGKRRAALNRAMKERPEFRLAHVRIVEMGGVYAGLYVLRRTPVAGG